MSRVSVIIVAAGEGKRFGSQKQYSLLKGKPVLDWSIQRFENHEAVNEIILVLKGADQKERLYSGYKKIARIVEGGEKRQDSVVNGFSKIDPEKVGIVLVHDAVRPLVGKDIISEVIKVASEKGAAIPVVPVEDTLKEVKQEEILITLKRTGLFRAQTPQGFSYSILKEALEKARKDDYYGTDEGSLVERIGKDVYAVEGSLKNIKITSLEDLEIAEALLEG